MDLPAGENGRPGFPGPINLGNPNEFTIRQLAEMVIKITNAKSKLVFSALPADDPMQRQPNIFAAQERLNQWRPRVELHEGLTKTIEYFDALLSENKLAWAKNLESQ